MKRCPECQRTYADDNTTFCLADGSLLSPPYDPGSPRGPAKVEPPPTEILESLPMAVTLPPKDQVSKASQQSTILADGISLPTPIRETPSAPAGASRRWLALTIASIAGLIAIGILTAVIVSKRAANADKNSGPLATALPSQSNEVAHTAEQTVTNKSIPSPESSRSREPTVTPTPTPPPTESLNTPQEKAKDILRRIRAGESFAALARAYSEDSGSKVNGGDLGWFGRGQMVAPFDKAAFALRPGQVSGIVNTVYGLCIIKSEGKRTEVVNGEPQEQVRARFILIGKK